MYNGSSKSLSLADLERLEAAGLSFTHLLQQASHYQVLVFVHVHVSGMLSKDISCLSYFYFLVCPSVCICLSRYFNFNYITLQHIGSQLILQIWLDHWQIAKIESVLQVQNDTQINLFVIIYFIFVFLRNILFGFFFCKYNNFVFV